jgi:hypothetical protein
MSHIFDQPSQDRAVKGEKMPIATGLESSHKG